MKTTLKPTPLEGLVVVAIEYSFDARGFFIESWNAKDFAAAGLPLQFKQHNHSSSSQYVLRGLHYQDSKAPIGKLVRCSAGTVFDVAVDLRPSSDTFGKWYGLQLSAENKLQLWVPVGFAHGFLALSRQAEVQYHQTGCYNPEHEGVILWNDPDIGVNWPGPHPVVSQRDQKQPSFKEYKENPAFE